MAKEKSTVSDAIMLRIQKLEKDTEQLFSKVNSVAISQACVDEKLSSMMVTLAELKSGLNELRDEPRSRWERLLGAIISSVVTLIFGILFGKWL